MPPLNDSTRDRDRPQSDDPVTRPLCRGPSVVRYVSTDSPITRSRAGAETRKERRISRGERFPGLGDPGDLGVETRARYFGIFEDRRFPREEFESLEVSEQAVGHRSPSEIPARSGIVLRGTRVPGPSYRGIAGIPCIPRSCITIANKRPLFGSVARSTGSFLRLCRFHQISGGYAPPFLARTVPPLAAFYLRRYLRLVA